MCIAICNKILSSSCDDKMSLIWTIKKNFENQAGSDRQVVVLEKENVFEETPINPSHHRAHYLRNVVLEGRSYTAYK